MNNRALPLAATVAVLLLGEAVLGAQAEASDWRQWRNDPGNRGVARLGGAARGAPAGHGPWRFRAGSHVWGYRPGMTVWSSPALGLVGGAPRLYAGSYDHNVYALDAASGELQWRFTTGGGVYATPALWAVPQAQRGDGDQRTPATVLFVSSTDRSLYALDAAVGSRLWIHTVKAWRPTIGGARLSSPAVGEVGGQPAVFFGHWVWDKSLSGHMQAAGLTALDARSGNKLWTAPLGDSEISAPLYVAPRGDEPARLFVAAADGNLHALDPASGERRWSSAARNAIKASPAFFRVGGDDVKGGEPRVVIGSKHGLVRCLDARDGSPRWRFKTGHWVDGSAAVAEVAGKPVVFVGSYDTFLYALDGKSGALRWRYRAAGGIYSSPAVVGEGDAQRVLFSAWDHHLHCLSARDGKLLFSAFTGRPLWDGVILGESTWASPAVAELGGRLMAYVGSYGGPLHAIPLHGKGLAALARPGSNVNFWVTLPVVLTVITALALGMTWRARRKRRLAATTGG